MADFVAVIRRAVDGLSNNTPDMRTKVYDKARGAVRRQLENMKPTPSEELIRRQMDKLEAAILSVEAEHAEALPADDVAEAPVAAPVPPLYGEPAPEPEAAVPEEAQPREPVEAEWPQEQASAIPSEEAPAYPEETTSLPQEEQSDYYAPAGEAGVEAPVYEEQPVEEPQRVEPEWPSHDAESEWPPRTHEGDEPVYEEVSSDRPIDGGEPLQTAAIASDRIAAWPESDTWEPLPEPGQAEPEADPFSGPDDRVGDSEIQGNEPQAWPVDDHAAAAGTSPAAADGWTWPPEEPVADTANNVWQEVPERAALSPETSEIPYTESQPGVVEAHFHEQTHAEADTVRMPPVSDLPELPIERYASDPANEFDDALRSQDEKSTGQSAKDNDPWNDLEELIGYNRDALPAENGAASAAVDDDGDMVPPRSYRVAPKKRNYAAPILALIGLLIVGAGGYALWINRDSITQIVGTSEPAAITEEPAPEEEVADAEPPATEEAPPAESEAPAVETAAPAAEDGAAADAKFTQRLLPDGTEVDEGPAATAATGEGQSVAQLNAPPATPSEAAPAEAAQAEPSATPADAAALSGEKMFLYEERLGQTAPTAIEGAVSWSLQREAGENGAQEPVVQGRINVPGRGLTALLTFKRNTDASLPASHLVEIVFAVPPGFEGGAIDSVQRIAMKQTEQDRGDALIAVPAKITDDFHMIALNDFPDARATNIELLRSRNWIDIPLAYRNGRRALLTLQKGEAGTQAFNDAIREWGTAGGGTPPAPTGQ
nr:membrane protein [Rhizobium sp. Q54]